MPVSHYSSLLSLPLSFSFTLSLFLCILGWVDEVLKPQTLLMSNNRTQFFWHQKKSQKKSFFIYIIFSLSLSPGCGRAYVWFWGTSSECFSPLLLFFSPTAIKREKKIKVNHSYTQHYKSCLTKITNLSFPSCQIAQKSCVDSLLHVNACRSWKGNKKRNFKSC